MNFYPAWLGGLKCAAKTCTSLRCPTLLSPNLAVLSNQTARVVRQLTSGCKSETSPVAAVRFHIRSSDDVLVWLVVSSSDVLYFPLLDG